MCWQRNENAQRVLQTGSWSADKDIKTKSSLDNKLSLWSINMETKQTSQSLEVGEKKRGQICTERRWSATNRLANEKC